MYDGSSTQPKEYECDSTFNQNRSIGLLQLSLANHHGSPSFSRKKTVLASFERLFRCVFLVLPTNKPTLLIHPQSFSSFRRGASSSGTLAFGRCKLSLEMVD
jgi:hypothetical protein